MLEVIRVGDLRENVRSQAHASSLRSVGVQALAATMHIAGSRRKSRLKAMHQRHDRRPRIYFVTLSNPVFRDFR